MGLEPFEFRYNEWITTIDRTKIADDMREMIDECAQEQFNMTQCEGSTASLQQSQ